MGRREGTLSHRPYRGDGKKGGDPVTQTVQRSWEEGRGPCHRDRTEVMGRREWTLSQRPYRGDGKKGGDPVHTDRTEVTGRRERTVTQTVQR